jgi:hypothetical protein
LDLICTDPNGESVFFRNRNVSSGGQLEIDMNVEYPDSKKPIENIFWQPGTAPSGTYNVYLLYYKNHEPNINETPYNVKIKYGGKTEEYKGVITKEDKPVHIRSFTVGTSVSKSTNQGSPPANDRQIQLEVERNRLQQELERINNELKRIGNGR